MATFTEVLPAQQSSPKNAAHWTPTGDGRGVLTIDTARCRCRYLVAELPAPKSVRCFRLVKLDPGTDAEGDVYTAGVGPRPADAFCECKGFIYGRGRPCKHTLAVRALLDNRWA